MGCFLEPVFIMLLTRPVLAPILQEYDVNLFLFPNDRHRQRNLMPPSKITGAMPALLTLAYALF